MEHAERRARLDQAIRDYYVTGMESGELTSNRLVTGWTLGIVSAGYDDDLAMESFVWELAPGMSTYTARGVADTLAETLANTAHGWRPEDD